MTRTLLHGIKICSIDFTFTACCSVKDLQKSGKTYDKVGITDPFTLAQEYSLNEDSTINYLLPVIRLQQMGKHYSQDIRSKQEYMQALGAYQSRITNLESELDKTLREWRSLYQYWDGKTDDSNYLAIDDGALNFLMNQCKDEKIVMLNENHFSPNHRLLLHLPLQKLYNNGFRYLGLEMLWETNINERGFAVNKSGFYTNEPMAANLIREAQNVGFRVFGYDDFTNDREKKQAENIYNNTFQLDSLAKVVILAGFEHIHEKIATNRNRMAAEFKRSYGIDPLTINQVEYKTDTNNLLAVIDTVLTPKSKKLQSDIYISNNLNYNAFAQLNHYRNYVIELPGSVINRINKSVRDYIINIYRKMDYTTDSTAVPSYNYMIKKQTIGKITIALPKDEYLLFVRDEYNELIFFGDMEVKNH
jgi:hypothetical protein